MLCSRRFEDQIKGIQEKSEKVKMEVGAPKLAFLVVATFLTF